MHNSGKSSSAKPKRKTIDRYQKQVEFSRILTFSDGLFAIAMTLLVVNIDLPSNVQSQDLSHAVSEVTPEIFSYFLSFAVIGIYWLTHHRLFTMIRRVDMRLTVMNLVFLSFVAFLPFPTELMGEYGDERISVVLYASSLSAIGIMQVTLYIYSARNGLFHVDVSASQMRVWVVYGLATPVVFLLSIPLAFVDVEATSYFWTLAFLLRPFISLVLDKSDKQAVAQMEE